MKLSMERSEAGSVYAEEKSEIGTKSDRQAEGM
jgi:hypothetical protein